MSRIWRAGDYSTDVQVEPRERTWTAGETGAERARTTAAKAHHCPRGHAEIMYAMRDKTTHADYIGTSALADPIHQAVLGLSRYCAVVTRMSTTLKLEGKADHPSTSEVWGPGTQRGTGSDINQIRHMCWP